MDDLKHTLDALKEVEARGCELNTERKRVEETIVGLRSPADDWLLFQARQELKDLNQQMETVQLEASALRIALRQGELPAALAAIEPLKKEFDAAMARFGQARKDADAVGFLVQQARSTVAGIEASIRENEKRIAEINQARARRAARAA